MRKKVAFIFAFPIRTNPMLITMPFGLNVITLLDRMGYEIDIYLSEYRNNSYEGLFTENVKIHFLDHNYLWPKEGIQSYIALTSYFKYLSTFKLRNKYGFIFGSGMAGITLGGILQRSNRNSQFIYLNDEFPMQGKRDKWVKSEMKYAVKADLVVTPDEMRFPPLAAQIKGLNKIPHHVLPNAPLLEELENIPTINWHEHFGIDSSKKLFLMAGGLNDFNLITELLNSVKMWPENTALILKGKNNTEWINEKKSELNIPGKIFWTVESFSPENLHSLIAYCEASICLYKPINDNLKYVGKSSGKLMRSILLGKPVIVSDSAMQFVEELGIGKIVYSEHDISSAVKFIVDNEQQLIEHCKTNCSQLSFEEYWKTIVSYLELE